MIESIGPGFVGGLLNLVLYGLVLAEAANVSTY